MVVVPAGRFTMGSPADEPERNSFLSEDQLVVTIAKPFAVGRFAVTRGEFAAFVAATGHKTDGAATCGRSTYLMCRPPTRDARPGSRKMIAIR